MTNFGCPHPGDHERLCVVRLWGVIGMFENEDRNFLIRSLADIHSAMNVIGRLVPINLSGS